ncbi:MAG: cbb3-type cytochrome oxidase assembly protein CcoS [Bacteroidales bacterium]|nr:cbb3-type cytochrome oxidase assembly protein CcoS [Bacteroidales bacterium]
MHTVIFLIIIGVIVAGGFLAAFIWAVRSGQYDDDYSPAVRILFDEPIKKEEKIDEVEITSNNNQK